MSDEILVLDLFSAAAGGWSLGMHRAGYRTMAACENVGWRRAIYAQNNPGVIIYDDVCTLTAACLLADLGCLPDVVVGSPPCQDISSANTKGKGVEGERSGLFFEAVRIIGECRPRWFALENSSNLRTRGADAVLAALEAIDYACWTFVVRAGDVGANHERPRAWIIGCDLGQVTNAHGNGRDARWSRGRFRGDLSASDDLSSARQTVDMPSQRQFAWTGNDGGERREGNGNELAHIPPPRRAGRDAPDADQAGQAGQADGCMEPSLRSAQVADDGRSDGRRHDGPGEREMAVRAADRSRADLSGPHWSLADLADRVWLDDGLPARVAGTRLAIGGPRGTTAASLIVEAYGDAVIPQIPEAIGHAILRVETAMRAALR